ncbi:MAG: response regulator [Ferruginibacter sp.]
MNKRGPILIIEDDRDDQEILIEIFKELNYENEVIFFDEGEKALEYLIATMIKPFIIFSDINMPKLNGLELRLKIKENQIGQYQTHNILLLKIDRLPDKFSLCKISAVWIEFFSRLLVKNTNKGACRMQDGFVWICTNQFE